jgi:rhodanese-related sulfurtransferase/predicted small secreted protein
VQKFNLRVLLCIILAIMMIAPLAGCNDVSGVGIDAADASTVADFMSQVGYTDADYEDSSEKGAVFLACGTGGRLDRIYEDGTVENIPLPIGEKHLTNLLISKNITFAAGLEGTLVYSQNGTDFQQAQGVGNEHLLGLAQLNSSYYAVTYSGKILSSKDGVTWQTSAELTDKPLISIAASETYLMAVTNDSDIYKSTDGITWTHQNYNEAYRGLSQEQSFTKILNLEETFVILGSPLESPDMPTVMFSYDVGETWSFSTLREINARPPEDFYPIAVNDVQFYSGELLAACNQGRMLTFTDCPTCNLITDAESTVDLRAMAIHEDALLIVGDDFHYEVLEANKLRQNNISPEQAMIEMEYGAVVIDVRTEEEHLAARIPGSILIPVEEIETRLEEMVPEKDSTILFYCVSGKKSQLALETALQLGYQNVFNLGGLSDWPYETE